MMRHATVLACMVLLGACSSSPPPRSAPQVTPVPAPGPERSTAPRPPANLDAIPDAVPRIEPRSTRGNPLSYEVFGKRYIILPTADGYVERGVASWYGPDFHTRSTSSGEPYDMYAMTAAHKTLPIPAYARVTNLSNGRSVVVRINDRGPFVDNRIIDLSYTAAHKLGMTQAGTAFVEVQVITPGSTAEAARGIAPPALPDPLTPPRHYLQAGAFGVAANATQMVERLRKAGVSNVLLREPDTATSLYRVRVGPIPNVAAFDSLAAQLARLGVDSRLITE
jgi:rare lipoprotein A